LTFYAILNLQRASLTACYKNKVPYPLIHGKYSKASISGNNEHFWYGWWYPTPSFMVNIQRHPYQEIMSISGMGGGKKLNCNYSSD